MRVEAPDEAVDRALQAIIVAVPPHRSVISRLLRLRDRLWLTPNRSAATAAWLLSVVVMIVTAARHATTTVQTSLGSARVACGINIYIYGDPDHAVANTCRRAEAGDFALFLISGALVVIGVVATWWVVRRESGPSTVGRRSVALSVAGAAATVVGLVALRPVPVALDRGGELVTLRCGADTYFAGYPDSVIQASCRNAFSGQAHVLEAALLVGLVALGTFLARTWRHHWIGLLAVALATIAAVSLAPINVTITRGATPEVASCGIDTYLAGYPDATVQQACRSHFGAKAAVGIPLGLIALGLASAELARLPRRRTQ